MLMQPGGFVMSTTYHAGDHTKNKIFEVSRHLFYTQGYEETTYDDISKAANINRALIPYHFKNKKNLALLVYKRLINDYFSICDQALENTQISEEGRTAFYMFGYYRLLKKPNFSKFLVQFHSDIDYNERMVTSKKRLFDIFIAKNPNVSDTDFELLSQMDFGIEKELIRISYYQEDADIDQLSSVEFRLILSFLGYAKEQVESIIAEAQYYLTHHKIVLLDKFHFEIHSCSPKVLL